MGEAGIIAASLTKAQRHAIVEAEIGYNDDDTLDNSGRRMLYRLKDRGLFTHRTGMSGADIQLTPLGRDVRSILISEAHHD